MKTARFGLLTLAIAAIPLSGCQSDPSVTVARINGSALAYVACAGVPAGSDVQSSAQQNCETARAAMAARPEAKGWAFESVTVFPMSNPGALFAAAGESADVAIVGPFAAPESCDAVRNLVESLGLKTEPCESRFAVGDVWLKSTL